MSNDSPAAVVSEMVRYFNAHDLDSLYGLMADNYRQYINGALVAEGPEGARLADAAGFDRFADYSRETVLLFGEGEQVALEWRLLGTTKGGTPVEMPAVSLLRVVGGRIAEAKIFFDPAAAGRS